MGGPLTGLRVVDLSNTQTSTHVSGFLADFGADVVHVEPPGGSPLRTQPAYPFWGRGKQSIVLDFHDADDLRVARDLAVGADVVIETFRPGVVERLGLGSDELRAENPALVYASVTAFGRTGELAGVKGYEGLVMARLGGHDSMGVIIDRPGPAFAAAPYTAWSGAQTALHGILAALFEREKSGVGQRIDTTLIQGFAAHDTWNAMIAHIARQYPRGLPVRSIDRRGLVGPQQLVVLPPARRALLRRPLAAVLADHAASVRGVHAGGRAGLDVRRPGVVHGPRLRRPRPTRRLLRAPPRRGRLEDRGRVERDLRPGTRRLGRDLPRRQRAAPPSADGARSVGGEHRRSDDAARCCNPVRWCASP